MPPEITKQEFIAAYVEAAREAYGFDEHYEFTAENAIDIMDDVTVGRNGPSALLKSVARQHGAKPGRVGNFLRGLR